jgi:dolichyl-phosphate-mannose--protein O-mannosyl transferase
MGIIMADKMNEPNENPRRYRWPWLVAAAVVLGIVLAIIWVGFAVKKVERERDLNAPLPNSAPGN